MAKDIVMSKGDMTIKISPDFQEYYEKQGYTVGEKKQKYQLKKRLKDYKRNK